ncbi:hypothetical protein BGX27_000038 [Mortierella sp. AM989]|nr:hypothetical protein BGX27_000038 [Mortierella sp. AM989]
MNRLVNYASESESESDESPPIAVTKRFASSSPSIIESKEHKEPVIELQQPVDSQDHGDYGDDAMQVESGDTDINDEGYLLTAIKDLQSFAATVDANNNTSSIQEPSLTPANESLQLSASSSSPSSSTIVDENQHVKSISAPENTCSDLIESTLSSLSIDLTPEQQSLFDAFLLDIDSIPLTSKDQSRPPVTNRDPSDSLANEPSLSEFQWQQKQSVQSIYSRMHQLSLLPSPLIDQKDIEARLIEFAIRILDWEQGGMKPAYFMGEERALAVSKRDAAKNIQDCKDIIKSEDEGDEDDSPSSLLPPYGGIVREMLDKMSVIEQTAAPSGWKVVWDPKECTYGFKHTISVRYVQALNDSACGSKL